ATGAARVRGALATAAAALRRAARGQAGHHRMGAGELRLRRLDRGGDREARLRPLLHPPHVAGARRRRARRDAARGAGRGESPLMRDASLHTAAPLAGALTIDVEEYFQVENLR